MSESNFNIFGKKNQAHFWTFRMNHELFVSFGHFTSDGLKTFWRNLIKFILILLGYHTNNGCARFGIDCFAAWKGLNKLAHNIACYSRKDDEEQSEEALELHGSKGKMCFYWKNRFLVLYQFLYINESFPITEIRSSSFLSFLKKEANYEKLNDL